MKHLDLNAYGVTEMENVEIQEIDGGGFWDTALTVLTAAALGPIGISILVMAATSETLS